MRVHFLKGGDDSRRGANIRGGTGYLRGGRALMPCVPPPPEKGTLPFNRKHLTNILTYRFAALLARAVMSLLRAMLM